MATIPENYCLALQHYQAGRLKETEVVCRQILQVQPNHPDALHLLGVIAHQTGKNDLAIEYIGEAIRVNPSDAEFHNSLGEAYRALDKLGEAFAHYQQALAINPSLAEAHCNLGIILRWRGKFEEAIAHLQQALAIKPLLPQAHNNLGTVFLEQGKLDEAVACYQRALALLPNFTEVRTNLAMALRAQGHTVEALQVLFQGLAGQPSSVPLRRSLAETLRGVALGTAGEQERAILVSLCTDDNISMMDLAIAIIGLVKNAPAFPRLLSTVRAGEDPFESAVSAADTFTHDPLLLAALPRMVIYDAELELVLTHLRRSIFLRAAVRSGLGSADSAIPYDFVCALARQCHLTEYAFFVTEEETKRVDELRVSLEAALQHPATDTRTLEWSLALAAFYDPLTLLSGWERLLTHALSTWSESFQPILCEQLINRQKEREIAARLTAITNIEDEVSQAVRRQYEDSPYPLWVSVSHPKLTSVEELAWRFRPGEDTHPFPHPVSILIAGCGTGQHPIMVARSYSDCAILAVDLSRTSLAYAVRMAERFGITNIIFHQADILKLDQLDRQFALIECVGVLHHLRDPLAGWRVLAGLLEPDGLMKIGLYSENARRCLPVVREFVRTQGYSPTPDGIRKCRRAIIDLPDGHAAKDVLTFGDFFTLNGYRDLIMHVQEHTFALPQIARCLDELGLRLLAFDCEVQVLERFRAMFPDNSARTDLALWYRFEEAHPDTFKGMYQFWCCRK